MASKVRGLKIDFSIFRMHFLQLLLCMYLSHELLMNPFFGAVTFILSNILALNFRFLFENAKKTNFRQLLGKIAATILVMSAVAMVFLYPIVTASPQSNYVSFYIVLLITRNVLSGWYSDDNDRKVSPFQIFMQLFLFAVCVVYATQFLHGYCKWISIGGYLLTGIMLNFENVNIKRLHGKYKDKETDLSDVYSYSVFSRMSVCAYTAFYLSTLMFVCFVCYFPMEQKHITYLYTAVWLVVLFLTALIISNLIKKSKTNQNKSLFIFGSILWIICSVKMYTSSKPIEFILCAASFSFCAAIIYSAMQRYNVDFKKVMPIAGKNVDNEEFEYKLLISQNIAGIISSCITLIILGIFNYVMPEFKETEIPKIFRFIIVQLPIIFMIQGVIYALRQPLDNKSKEKLQVYYEQNTSDDVVHESLKNQLIRKYRVRVGVKVIATFVRPFLHLKVYGKEHLKQGEYPSIFICNHGIIYGPIAAVLYLPTYFRPWIDRKMLDCELSAEEMYGRMFFRLPLLSEKAKRKISCRIAKIVTWALNSFNPIAVERDNLRNVMSTFNLTIDALQEGDNILIFPERPHKVEYDGVETVVHETKDVGNLFTGFANLGKLYYQKCKKCLHFYPIYADKNKHTFRIGEPVIYNPENNSQEEKQRIAMTLQSKMKELRDKNSNS